MGGNGRSAFGRLARRRIAAASLFLFAAANGAHAEDGAAVSGAAGLYAGAFAGFGKTANRIVDVAGFNERRLHSALGYMSPTVSRRNNPASRSNRPPETVRPQGPTPQGGQY